MSWKILWTLTIACSLSAALAGCRTTNVTALSPEIWQIETNSSGLLFTHGADTATMKKAAKLTLEKGYTHFVILDNQARSGSVYAGTTPTTVQGSISANHAYSPTGFGGFVGTTNGQLNASVSGGEPIYRPTRANHLTIFLLKSDKHDEHLAFNARDVLEGSN